MRNRVSLLVRYESMSNPYHDELGKFCSRDEMQAAIKKLADRGDLEGYFQLRTELHEIDKTNVVKTQTEEVLAHKQPPLVSTLTYADEVWDKASADWVTTRPGSIGGVDAHVGDKWDPKMDILDIKRDVAKDLKAFQENGALPKDLEYSITTSRQGYVPSINVQIRGVKDDTVYDGMRVTPSALDVRNRVLSIIDRHNYRESAPQIDHRMSTFYSSASFETEQQRKTRLNNKVVAKKAVASRNHRKDFLNKLKDEKVKTNVISLFDSSKEDNGVGVGRVKGTALFVTYKRDDAGNVRPIQGYDLGGLDDKYAKTPATDMDGLFSSFNERRRNSAVLKRKKFKLI